MTGPPLRLRLASTIELFPASDGALYLLRGSATDEFVLRDPTPFDRALLHALSDAPADVGALCERVRRADVPASPEQVDAAIRQLIDLRLVQPVEPPDESLLTPEERERYDRQFLYLEELTGSTARAHAVQRRLIRATVALIGCGGLGSWAACGLACAGVGTLVLVDDDRVELSNLNRQLLFKVSDVGRRKVDAAGDALRAFNPATTVRTRAERVASPADVADIVAGVDLAVVTADWPPYELPRWVDEACFAAGIGFLTAGQFPPRIRVGPLYLPGRTPCLACHEAAIRAEHPLYDELAAQRQRTLAPAATLGAASGLIGSIIAMDATYLLGDLAPPATLGRSVIVDLRTMATTATPIAAQSSCPRCRRET